MVTPTLGCTTAPRAVCAALGNAELGQSDTLRVSERKASSRTRPSTFQEGRREPGFPGRLRLEAQKKAASTRETAFFVAKS
jgi:hypothetical protein